MSNQVYSNESRKFYALPGMNAYVMQSNVTIANATVNAPNTVPSIGVFNFSTAPNSVINDDSLLELEPSVINIKKEGMYSVRLTFQLENAVSTSTSDIDYYAFMRLSRTGSLNFLILDSVEERIVAPGSSAGSNQRIKSLSFIGYLNSGDGIGFVLENYGGQNLRILANQTQLIVNKIY